ncbi:MAG: MFS transporter [Chitinophagaceae bacterium]|nr:MFS transporter [Chitinophagaceae bacterium]
MASIEKKERLWNKNFIIACLTYFLVACSFNLLMPTIPLFLSGELGVSPSKIGVVLSSYAAALLIIRPFSGYLVDVYARKPLFVLGISLFVLTFAGYYFAVSVLFFIVLRFVHGLFWGLSTVSANTVAIDIIPASRRAEGVGYFGVNINIAMAIAPYIAVKIYDAYHFSALISSALFMGSLSIIASLFIKVPYRKKLDKVPPISPDRFILVRAIPIFLNQLLLSFGWGTLVAFAVLYGKRIGIQNSGIFFLFLAGGIVFSRVTSGKLVDRGYLHQVMAVAILLISGGYVGFALVHDIYVYCIAAFLIGTGYGTLFPALQTIYINMAPASKRGTANSTYLTGFDLGIGTGMLTGAWLAGIFGFANMFLITGGLSFVALFIYWFNSRKVYEKGRLV